uniref:Uncharacterized protein n=1 Tax=Pseudo-nitzschia australis TaxID=44445 RepID=A0A7S4EIB2_9STRA
MALAIRGETLASNSPTCIEAGLYSLALKYIHLPKIHRCCHDTISLIITKQYRSTLMSTTNGTSGQDGLFVVVYRTYDETPTAVKAGVLNWIELISMILHLSYEYVRT